MRRLDVCKFGRVQAVGAVNEKRVDAADQRVREGATRGIASMTMR
jgi:hypothetical protein